MNSMLYIGNPGGPLFEVTFEDLQRGIPMLHKCRAVFRKANIIDGISRFHIKEKIGVEPGLSDSEAALQRIVLGARAIEPAVSIDQPIRERKELALYRRFGNR